MTLFLIEILVLDHAKWRSTFSSFPLPLAYMFPFFVEPALVSHYYQSCMEKSLHWQYYCFLVIKMFFIHYQIRTSSSNWWKVLMAWKNQVINWSKALIWKCCFYVKLYSQITNKICSFKIQCFQDIIFISKTDKFHRATHLD